MYQRLNNICVTIEELKYIKAYQHLEMIFLKLLFSGPPRIEKSTACRRLQGEIVNLVSAGEADQFHPSTGVIKLGPDIIVKRVKSFAAIVTESEWSATKSYIDKACMLFNKLKQNIEAKK